MEQKVREERFQAAVAWVRGLPAAGAGEGARVSNQVSLRRGLGPPSPAGRTALGSADRRTALTHPNPTPAPPVSPRTRPDEARSPRGKKGRFRPSRAEGAGAPPGGTNTTWAPLSCGRAELAAPQRLLSGAAGSRGRLVRGFGGLRLTPGPPQRPNTQTRLDFYALFKQSQKGDASAGEAPGWTSGPVARAKYNAWAGLKGTPREAAKARYVQLLEGLDPAFSASQPAPAVAPAPPAAAPAAAPGGPSHPLSPQPSTATALGVVPAASTSGRLPAFDASPSLASFLPSPPPPTVESLGLAAARSEAPAGGAGDGDAASPAALTVRELQQLRLKMKATDLRMDSLESELSSMKTELTVLKHKAKTAEAFGVPLTVGLFMVAWPIVVYRWYLPKA